MSTRDFTALRSSGPEESSESLGGIIALDRRVLAVGVFSLLGSALESFGVTRFSFFLSSGTTISSAMATRGYEKMIRGIIFNKIMFLF